MYGMLHALMACREPGCSMSSAPLRIDLINLFTTLEPADRLWKPALLHSEPAMCRPGHPYSLVFMKPSRQTLAVSLPQSSTEHPGL